MEQFNVDEFMAHSGVLGMKWGHRKAETSTSTGGSTKKTHAELKEMARREKILKSPSKLYRHRNEFTQKEIDDAMKTMRLERELRSLTRDEISTGSQYANAILAYGTVATTAYGLYKSPLGQMAVSQIKKAW